MVVLSASGPMAEDAIVAISVVSRYHVVVVCFSKAVSLRVQALANVELSWAKLFFHRSGSEWLFMSNHVRPKMYPLLPRQSLHMSASRLAIVDAVAAVDAVVLWHVVAVVSFGGDVFEFSVLGNSFPVRSCCLGGGSCAFLDSGSSAPSLIIISRISFSASEAIRTCSSAHLIAVARCQ